MPSGGAAGAAELGSGGGLAIGANGVGSAGGAGTAGILAYIGFIEGDAEGGGKFCLVVERGKRWGSVLG